MPVVVVSGFLVLVRVAQRVYTGVLRPAAVVDQAEPVAPLSRQDRPLLALVALTAAEAELLIMSGTTFQEQRHPVLVLAGQCALSGPARHGHSHKPILWICSHGDFVSPHV